MGRSAIYICIQVLVQVSTASRPQHLTTRIPSLIQKSVRDIHTGADVFDDFCGIDVIMVVDTSGSICDQKRENCQNWRDQRDAAAHFAEQLSRKQSSRSGVLTFSNHAQWRAKLTTNVNSVVSQIRNLDYVTLDLVHPRNRWTNLKEALLQAGEELRSNPNRDHRQVVLVFTDGEPSTGGFGPNQVNGAGHVAAAKMAAESVKATAQLAMVAIGSANTFFMQSLVTQPVSKNFFPKSTFRSLTKPFIDGLLQEICKATQPTPRPIVTPQPTSRPFVTPQPTSRPVVPPPTPQQTPQPPPSPTPPSFCEKDTRAVCGLKNLCFQWTRGSTECRTSFDGKRTCHCVEEDECVHNASMPLTKGRQWGVCRRFVGGQRDPSDVRGEDNPVNWFFRIALDIFHTYFRLIR